MNFLKVLAQNVTDHAWEDNDGDGVCDCLEFPGCTDVVACNF